MLYSFYRDYASSNNILMLKFIKLYNAPPPPPPYNGQVSPVTIVAFAYGTHFGTFMLYVAQSGQRLEQLHCILGIGSNIV